MTAHKSGIALAGRRITTGQRLAAARRSPPRPPPPPTDDDEEEEGAEEEEEEEEEASAMQSQCDLADEAPDADARPADPNSFDLRDAGSSSGSSKSGTDSDDTSRAGEGATTDDEDEPNDASSEPARGHSAKRRISLSNAQMAAMARENVPPEAVAPQCRADYEGHLAAGNAARCDGCRTRACFDRSRIDAAWLLAHLPSARNRCPRHPTREMTGLRCMAYIKRKSYTAAGKKKAKDTNSPGPRKDQKCRAVGRTGIRGADGEYVDPECLAHLLNALARRANIHDVRIEAALPVKAYRRAEVFVLHCVKAASEVSLNANSLQVDETRIGARKLSRGCQRAKAVRRQPFWLLAAVSVTKDCKAIEARMKPTIDRGADVVQPFAEFNVAGRRALLISDGFKAYNGSEKFAKHYVVEHAHEFVREEDGLKITTNTVESLNRWAKETAKRWHGGHYGRHASTAAARLQCAAYAYAKRTWKARLKAYVDAIAAHGDKASTSKEALEVEALETPRHQKKLGRPPKSDAEKAAAAAEHSQRPEVKRKRARDAATILRTQCAAGRVSATDAEEAAASLTLLKGALTEVAFVTGLLLFRPQANFVIYDPVTPKTAARIEVPFVGVTGRAYIPVLMDDEWVLWGINRTNATGYSSADAGVVQRSFDACRRLLVGSSFNVSIKPTPRLASLSCSGWDIFAHISPPATGTKHTPDTLSAMCVRLRAELRHAVGATEPPPAKATQPESPRRSDEPPPARDAGAAAADATPLRTTAARVEPPPLPDDLRTPVRATQPSAAPKIRERADARDSLKENKLILSLALAAVMQAQLHLCDERGWSRNPAVKWCGVSMDVTMGWALAPFDKGYDIKYLQAVSNGRHWTLSILEFVLPDGVDRLDQIDKHTARYKIKVVNPYEDASVSTPAPEQIQLLQEVKEFTDDPSGSRCEFEQTTTLKEVCGGDRQHPAFNFVVQPSRDGVNCGRFVLNAALFLMNFVGSIDTAPMLRDRKMMRAAFDRIPAEEAVVLPYPLGHQRLSWWANCVDYLLDLPQMTLGDVEELATCRAKLRRAIAEETRSFMVSVIVGLEGSAQRHRYLEAAREVTYTPKA